MNDLAMTCRDFVNVLKMLICSEKHPVSRANYGYTKKSGDRYRVQSSYRVLISRTIFCKF